jgi:hypothetical protein
MIPASHEWKKIRTGPGPAQKNIDIGKRKIDNLIDNRKKEYSKNFSF